MAEWGECSNCGYEGYNDTYHWGTGEIECDRCGHEYFQTKAMKRKGREKRKGAKMGIFSWDREDKKQEPEKKASSLLGELMVRQALGEIQRREEERQGEKEREKTLQRAERERPNREITIGSKRQIIANDNRRIIVINNPIINNYYGNNKE